MRFALTIVAACAMAASPASARARHHRPAHEPPPVSQDAVELATLAPPSPASTFAQTYGDAAYARARLERRIAREERADAAAIAEAGGAPMPCEPRYPTASAYVCDGGPGAVDGRARSYGQGYAFTPSSLSAPQRFTVPPDEQSPLLPPFTALSWAANNLRFDPHN